jgi:hypothetical protein
VLRGLRWTLFKIDVMYFLAIIQEMIMSTIFLLLAVVTLGYAAYICMRDLSALYPFMTTNRFWWCKYLPLLGLSLVLIVAGEPLVAYVPGFSVIFGSRIFLLKRVFQFGLRSA